MTFQPGDRVRATHGMSNSDGTVRRVTSGRRLPMISGENVVTAAMVDVDWDDVPGAQTAAQRTSHLPADALERVPPG